MAFADDWKKKKLDFQKLTGKKKPADSTAVFFRKGTGVADALKKLDAALVDKKGDVASMRKAFGVAKTAADAYDKKLSAAFAADSKKKGPDHDTWKKGVDVLSKELKAVMARARNQIEQKEIAAKDQSGEEKIAELIVSGTRPALKKMTAFLASAKAQKTTEDKVKVFNDGIQKATRDVTQNINNALKLQKKGKAWNGKDMTNVGKILTAWANDGRRIKDPARADSEISAVEQVVKGVNEWYQANK